MSNQPIKPLDYERHNTWQIINFTQYIKIETNTGLKFLEHVTRAGSTKLPMPLLTMNMKNIQKHSHEIWNQYTISVNVP